MELAPENPRVSLLAIARGASGGMKPGGFEAARSEKVATVLFTAVGPAHNSHYERDDDREKFQQFSAFSSIA